MSWLFNSLTLHHNLTQVKFIWRAIIRKRKKVKTCSSPNCTISFPFILYENNFTHCAIINSLTHHHLHIWLSEKYYWLCVCKSLFNFSTKTILKWIMFILLYNQILNLLTTRSGIVIQWWSLKSLFLEDVSWNVLLNSKSVHWDRYKQ